ncbi:MAG: 30S ribosome-binding factor RbfA [Gemmatimonadota bacterium]|nr:MAG: 30S ribosome-binding factor RbfA [Gemmatimonadota bacterium]
MTRASRHRGERLAALIREGIAEALATRVKDPRIGFVTVTRVTVSADVAHATVRVSVMGTEDQKDSSMAGLDHARGFLRTHLARTLELRTAPQLHFVLDRGLENASRIDTILEEIKREEQGP